MKATFSHSVDVLVKAYLNGTLAHRICTACAVGNLVADALGKKMKKHPQTVFDSLEYEDGYRVSWGYFSQMFPFGGSEQLARAEIKATGYTPNQIAAIEIAFESVPSNGCALTQDYTNDDWMLRGLFAVVDVLAEIHGIDLDTKESAKLLFVKS